MLDSCFQLLFLSGGNVYVEREGVEGNHRGPGFQSWLMEALDELAIALQI